jgi:beta-lactamase class A
MLFLFIFSAYTPVASALTQKQLLIFKKHIYNYNAETCAPLTPVAASIKPGSDIADDELPGKDNNEKVWHYLIGLGFTPVEAAGILGNILREGVMIDSDGTREADPQSIEDPAGRTKDYEVFKNLTASNEGYGLIGFTPGIALMKPVPGWADWSGIAKVNVTKDNFYFISTQLDVVYGYMKNSTAPNGKNMLKAYKARATSAPDAASAFQDLVENAGVVAAADRDQYAKDMLKKYGDASTVDAPVAADSPEAGQCRCVTGSDTGDSLIGADNTEKAYNFFISKKLSPEDSASIVGNLIIESGQDPISTTAENPDTHAYGIAQWLGGRYTALVEYASKHGGSKSDIEIQLNYLWDVDLPANEPGFHTLELIKKAATIEEKAAVWEDTFERSGGALIPDRQAAAKAVFKKYGEGGALGGAVTSPSGASCECPSPNSTSAAINEKLKQLAEANGGKTSISVETTDGSASGDANGTVQMPTRSSYKIYTAYATLRAIEAGDITWSSNIHGPHWSSHTIDDTMEQMIVNSNNEAAEALRLNSKIGTPSAVTNMLQNDVGLSNKTIMGDGDNTNSNSVSTSNDFSKFLVLLEKNKLPGVKRKENYDHLINLMKKATTDGSSARAGIVAGVGKDTDVADKPGWSGTAPTASNDVGIVYLKSNPYVVSILTDAPNQWSGVATIAKGVNELMGGSDAAGGADCVAAGNGDLTAIVETYAWPKYSNPNYDPTAAYKTAYDKAVKNGQYPGSDYTDCGAFVTRAMIDSGYEPGYNYGGKLSAGAGNTINQMAWLKSHWQKVAMNSTKDLQPGDVAISSSHTYMYTGKIDGFQYAFASASQGSRVPMSSDYYDAGFTWYRKE